MALTATIYSLETDLADVDRGVYEHLALRMARRPVGDGRVHAHTLPGLLPGVRRGIGLTDGVAAGDEPAVLVRDLTGRVTAWIEVGMPSAERVHRGSKIAGRTAVYTHRNVNQVLSELNNKRIHRAAEIPVYEFGRGFVDTVAQVLERRTSVALSITEQELYLDLNGRSFTTAVAEHRFG